MNKQADLTVINDNADPTDDICLQADCSGHYIYQIDRYEILHKPGKYVVVDPNTTPHPTLLELGVCTRLWKRICDVCGHDRGDSDEGFIDSREPLIDEWIRKARLKQQTTWQLVEECIRQGYATYRITKEMAIDVTFSVYREVLESNETLFDLYRLELDKKHSPLDLDNDNPIKFNIILQVSDANIKSLAAILWQGMPLISAEYWYRQGLLSSIDDVRHCYDVIADRPYTVVRLTDGCLKICPEWIGSYPAFMK